MKKLAALILCSTIVGHVVADEGKYVLDPDTQITLPEGFDAELLCSVPGETLPRSFGETNFQPQLF